MMRTRHRREIANLRGPLLDKTSNILLGLTVEAYVTGGQVTTSTGRANLQPTELCNNRRGIRLC
ncbi:hypothetical protein V7714_09795 [Chitinimonas sp. JJ19]